MGRPQRQINKIIIHCSDTPETMDIGVLEIDEWHEERGFSQSSNGHYCGYHWVIKRNGVIEMGRNEVDVGAHCFGNNRDSIGVCLVGRGVYTEDQKVSLFYILDHIMGSYGLYPKQVFGHYEFTPHKKCPLIDMDKLRDELELRLGEEDDDRNEPD